MMTERTRNKIEGDYVFLQERPMRTTAGEWRRAALRDLINLRLSSVDKKSKANEYAVRLCNYMDVYNNNFIHADLDFMTATATQREIAKCSLEVGDVIITKDSEKHDDIGVPALVRKKIPNLVCGYHLAILRPRPSEVDGPFLFYALSNYEAQQQFHSFANGITRFGLRKADIGLVEIPLPPLAEQRAIAHVLGTLDDKIELNRRMNETLEAMARALFKSWFVDFEPVRAKKEGRWRRGESFPGLPADLYDVFPQRLAPSELGEIPEGWEVRTLGEVVELNPREPMKRGTLAPSTLTWLPCQHPAVVQRTLSYESLSQVRVFEAAIRFSRESHHVLRMVRRPLSSPCLITEWDGVQPSLLLCVPLRQFLSSIHIYWPVMQHFGHMLL